MLSPIELNFLFHMFAIEHRASTENRYESNVILAIFLNTRHNAHKHNKEVYTLKINLHINYQRLKKQVQLSPSISLYNQINTKLKYFMSCL